MKKIIVELDPYQAREFLKWAAIEQAGNISYTSPRHKELVPIQDAINKALNKEYLDVQRERQRSYDANPSLKRSNWSSYDPA